MVPFLMSLLVISTFAAVAVPASDASSAMRATTIAGDGLVGVFQNDTF